MTASKLLTLLIALDAKRAVLADLKKEEAALTEEVVDEMRIQRLDYADLYPGRRAVLERPIKTTVPPPAFTAACLQRGIDPADYAAALKQTVQIAKARKLLGADALDALAKKRPGNYRVRFVGARSE